MTKYGSSVRSNVLARVSLASTTMLLALLLCLPFLSLQEMQGVEYDDCRNVVIGTAEKDYPWTSNCETDGAGWRGDNTFVWKPAEEKIVFHWKDFVINEDCVDRFVFIFNNLDFPSSESLPEVLTQLINPRQKCYDRKVRYSVKIKIFNRNSPSVKCYESNTVNIEIPPTPMSEFFKTEKEPAYVVNEKGESIAIYFLKDMFANPDYASCYADVEVARKPSHSETAWEIVPNAVNWDSSLSPQEQKIVLDLDPGQAMDVRIKYTFNEGTSEHYLTIPRKGNDNNLQVVVIVGSSTAALVILTLVIFFLVKRIRRKKVPKCPSEEVFDPNYEYGTYHPTDPSLDYIIVSDNNDYYMTQN